MQNKTEYPSGDKFRILNHNIKQSVLKGKIDVFVKSPICSLFVILQKQESSNFRLLWTPAFAGVTRFLAFCESIKIEA
jgi:hypothetical protein